jgi:single-strand DNA-binding protein
MTNVVVLRGRVNRPPAERVLPSGDHLTTIDITLSTAPGGDDGPPREAVPLAWFSAPAWAIDLEPGDEIVVAGRVRRRFFRSSSGLQSRTEVVVESGAPARQTARAAAVLRRAVEALAAEVAHRTGARATRPTTSR